MNTSELMRRITEHAAYFPETEPRIARRQAKKLIRAKVWLTDHELCAIAIGSKFVYARDTASVLGQ